MDYKKMELTLNEHIGTKIRLKRKQRNMTLQQLGSFLDLTPQQIQKYEKGRQRITADMLWDLSKLFNVPVQFFYEGFIESEKTFLKEDETPFDYGQNETEELLNLYYKLKNRKALIAFLHMIVENEKEG